MFTSTLPIDLHRYQVRYYGTRPVAANADRKLAAFEALGVLEPSDLGQAQRNGIPSWNVSLLLIDRADGRHATTVVRTESPSEPNVDFHPGQVVTFDRLEVGFSEVGRMRPQFSYLAMRPSDEAPLSYRGETNRFAVLPDGLTIEVNDVRPKLDQQPVSDNARAIARAQNVDLTEHLKQQTNAQGVPKWELACVIITPDGFYSDKITVASATEPQVSGLVTVEGLTIMGGETPYPNVMRWVALGAERVFAQHAPTPAGRRGRKDEAPAEQPTEHVEQHA